MAGNMFGLGMEEGERVPMKVIVMFTANSLFIERELYNQ